MQKRQPLLAPLIDRLTSSDGAYQTAIPSLTLNRWSHPGAGVCVMTSPALTIAVQGIKRVMLGDETYTYDAAHYLVTAVDLPVVAQIITATPQAPYLCLSLQIDRRIVDEILATMPPVMAPVRVSRGIGVNPLTPPLVDAACRLVRLLDTPRDILTLAPLIEREILYRALSSDDSGRLTAVSGGHGQSRQIARAIAWIVSNYAQPLRVETLAREVGMSVSSFHYHFKALTALTPLQYQKHLRLAEARRLMLTEQLDAASASYRVGYESPSHFSREYRRRYGAPPARHIETTRQAGSV